MNTNPPLESLTARAWGMRVYTASPPGSPQYHSRGGLSGPGMRRYLSGKLSKPKPMATNHPPLPRSRAALPLGFPYLCLGYLWLSVARAAAPVGHGSVPDPGAHRARQHRLVGGRPRHGARRQAGVHFERMRRQDGPVATGVLPAVLPRRQRVVLLLRTAHAAAGRQGRRDLSWFVRDAGRVSREQLRLRRHRHLDQVGPLTPRGVKPAGFARHTRLLFVGLLALVACQSNGRERQSPGAPAWLIERARQERELAARSSVVHDFGFTDGRAASGISFENHAVDDAGKAYKKVHYDHGTGLCAADVDGDGLPDLYFVTQLGTTDPWKNLGGRRFANIPDETGLTMRDAVAVGCAFADIDNDGDPDLFVTTVRHGNRLFENLGGGKFRDITAQAGVGYVGHSSGAVFFDYDGDGLLDLFVTNVGVYTSNTKGPGGYYVGLPDAFHGHLHPERAEASI